MNVASDHLVAHAFDAIAADYDRRYTNNPTMRLMRRRVWKTLHARIAEGCRILELGCGTGEDAVFLAKSGCEVVATDCSPKMLECAAQKCSLHGLDKRVRFELARMDDSFYLPKYHATRFHGILANFGGLNTVRDLASLDRPLHDLLEPGGWFVATVMGPCCLWDWVIEMVRFRFAEARARRPTDGGPVTLGGVTIPCYFPSLNGFLKAFNSFRLERCEALGLLLPPPRITSGRAGLHWLWATLETMERPLARLPRLRTCGDHYLAVLGRI